MENNQRSPEQNQDDTSRHTPAKEDAAKPQPQKTDAEIEETGKEREASKSNKKISADTVNSITGSATDKVRSRRSGDTLANTGTNVSYEGPTSTAAGGTGYNSGRPATGARITGADEYDAGGVNRVDKDSDADTKDLI